MGGPGVIFNDLTLKKLEPYIKTCLKSLQTDHEDVEVGRCLFKKLKVSCTNNLEMKEMFRHETNVYLNSIDNINADPALMHHTFNMLSKSLTLHPFKLPDHMLKVYLFALKQQREIQKYKIVEVLKEIKEYEEQSSDNASKDIKGDKPMEKSIETTTWDTYTRDQKYGESFSGRIMPSPFPSHWKNVLRYLTSDIENDLNKGFFEKGRIINYRGFHYGYGKQMENNEGIRYILDLFLNHIQIKKGSQKKTTKVRKHVYLEQRFLPVRFNPSINGLDKHSTKALNVILPLYQKLERFDIFLSNYDKNFLYSSQNTDVEMRLIVVVFTPSADSTSDKSFILEVKEKLETMKEKYPNKFRYVLTPPINETFSRAKGLDYGVRFVCESQSDLMFFVDVDMFFNVEAVNTIRLLTIKGKSVYFPIVYSTFDQSTGRNKPTEWNNVTDFTTVSGYWRQFGYGMVSMYKSDYVGMDLTIHGWGKEDVTLYDHFLEHKPHLELIRAADPDIIHLYHPVKCDPNLPNDQLQMCHASSYSNYKSTLDAALEIERLNITHW